MDPGPSRRLIGPDGPVRRPPARGCQGRIRRARVTLIVQFNHFEQMLFLIRCQDKARQNCKFNHLSETNRMLHILLNVNRERSPVVHIYCQFHNLYSVRNISTDPFGKLDQSPCVCHHPFFPRSSVIFIMSSSDKLVASIGCLLMSYQFTVALF